MNRSKAGLHKDSRNILLFGANGQLGTKLNTLLATKGTVHAIGHSELDLRDLARLRARILETNPALIVNAAAYTAVDAAESDVENAQLVNAQAPRVMAEAARECNALFVHYSTDYVFDGTARTPYTEASPVRPLGVYGETKLAGEQAVAAAGAAHLILRTAWLYSNRGKSFLKTRLRLAAERDELRVVNDQTAAHLCRPGRRCQRTDAGRHVYQRQPAHGTLRPLSHRFVRGETTWWGFAQRIIELAGLPNACALCPSPRLTTDPGKTPGLFGTIGRQT